MIHLNVPGGKQLPLTEIGTDLLTKARKESIEQGSSRAAVISSVVVAMFDVPTPGRIEAVITIENEEIFSASLNVSERGS